MREARIGTQPPAKASQSGGVGWRSGVPPRQPLGSSVFDVREARIGTQPPAKASQSGGVGWRSGVSTTAINVFYSNVTFWGKAVEKFFANDPSQILMAVEHRLDQNSFPPVSTKIAKHFGRSYFHTLAERTGQHKLATSGGQIIMPFRHLQCTPVEDSLINACVPGGRPEIKRWTSMVLRTKGVSVLFVLVYLRTGEEMSDQNAAILQQIFLVCAHFAGQVIVGGDWQMEPQTVAGSPWISRLGLKFLVPNVDATCTAGRGRIIDYFIVSEGLHPFIFVEPEYAVE